MAVGSRITVVARPRREGDAPMTGSLQFMLELLGTNAVQGEEPPRILHFNPRIRGDFSGRPVIELNTCYRMQWAQPQRCQGWASRPDEDTVDGELKCEGWIHDEDNSKTKLEEESRIKLLLNRLVGRPNKVSVDQPYPFAEGTQFVLTIIAGLEGYHINVDGRHVASFPYRIGYILEDATGLSLKGDLDVESISADYLPNSPPTFTRQRYLEMSEQWKASPLPTEPVELFIGILSAANHFAERMAVRKSWMISTRRSSSVVARFFVALNREKEVNEELKKEAEYFGDIVIVPFMDSYDLVVLKTIAMAEYGVRVVPAKYIMKVQSGKSLYVGNINYYHRTLRSGKWAVTYEEWPEDVYPPYANGPGYVISSDIAQYIISEFDNKTLRLFKMEDVSMGMWVEKFSVTSRPVEYLHDVRFYQPGCFDGYFTAHYQSPQHMICLWRKLQSGSAQCCNVR
ncbi:hypothetical protein QOZ80_3AG0211970 [Eleusine coracana subsp. coracana]|nr:hypothetical protein QOZ80_3AG0211970 [Eleusine coracana subsp. coracana]